MHTYTRLRIPAWYGRFFHFSLMILRNKFKFSLKASASNCQDSHTYILGLVYIQYIHIFIDTYALKLYSQLVSSAVPFYYVFLCYYYIEMFEFHVMWIFWILFFSMALIHFLPHFEFITVIYHLIPTYFYVGIDIKLFKIFYVRDFTFMGT